MRGSVDVSSTPTCNTRHPMQKTTEGGTRLRAWALPTSYARIRGVATSWLQRMRRACKRIGEVSQPRRHASCVCLSQRPCMSGAECVLAWRRVRGRVTTRSCGTTTACGEQAGRRPRHTTLRPMWGALPASRSPAGHLGEVMCGRGTGACYSGPVSLLSHDGIVARREREPANGSGWNGSTGARQRGCWYRFARAFAARQRVMGGVRRRNGAGCGAFVPVLRDSRSQLASAPYTPSSSATLHAPSSSASAPALCPLRRLTCAGGGGVGGAAWALRAPCALCSPCPWPCHGGGTPVDLGLDARDGRRVAVCVIVGGPLRL
jgi:hypothetical protein